MKARYQEAGAVCQYAVGAILVYCLVLAGCARTASDSPRITEQSASLVPFEDLFVSEDTLVLDHSVVLGFIWFMDVDASGNVLVTDMTSSLVHLFASAGTHQATYDMDTCLPIDGQHRVWSARFAESDRIILSTLGGDMVVLARDGSCLATRRRLLNTTQSFCSRGDSIYAFRGVEGLGSETTSVLGAFSMDLETMREIRLDSPRLVGLNINDTGFVGRNIACFRDGPYFKYHEDMDARPVRLRSHVVMARPEFYVQQKEDVGRPGSDEWTTSNSAATLLYGLYAVDDDTRLSVFNNIADQYRPEGVVGGRVYGLSIGSNSGAFQSVSTIAPKAPRSAGNGYLYFVGEHVHLADGDVGNPTVIRYRFNAPQAADG